MDRIGNIFIEIKTKINYIINDSDFIYSNKDDTSENKLSVNDIINSYDFNYEFSFDINDIVDINRFDTIYNKCNIPDTTGDRRDIIYKKCLETLTLLGLASGIRIFSSFVTINNTIYKVTVFNIQWSGSGLF